MVKVLPGRVRSKRNVSPSPAAVAVIRSIICWAAAAEVPYLPANRSAYGPGCSAGAFGSSSKLRHTTATSARCGKRARAASNRRLPM